MAHMQRACWVGRDKLNHQALAIARLVAETATLRQNVMHDLLLGSRLQLDIDKARASNFDGFNPARKGWRGQQCRFQVLSQLAGIHLKGLGQLHGNCGGQIAMGRHLGRFKNGFVAGTRQQGFKGSRKRLQKFNFYR